MAIKDMKSDVDFRTMQEFSVYFIRQLESLKSIVGENNSELKKQIEDLEKSFSNSLGFLEEILNSEMDRNDGQAHDLEDVILWRAEIQEQLAEIVDKLDQLDFGKFQQQMLEEMTKVMLKTFQEMMLKFFGEKISYTGKKNWLWYSKIVGIGFMILGGLFVVAEKLYQLLVSIGVIT